VSPEIQKMRGVPGDCGFGNVRLERGETLSAIFGTIDVHSLSMEVCRHRRASQSEHATSAFRGLLSRHEVALGSGRAHVHIASAVQAIVDLNFGNGVDCVGVREESFRDVLRSPGLPCIMNARWSVRSTEKRS
jgi:hypothetical protein